MVNHKKYRATVKLLDNVASVVAGYKFGSYENSGFYVISLTDGSVRVALADMIDKSRGVHGAGDEAISQGTAFHTPLYVTAKVFDKNQISPYGYVENHFTDVNVNDYYYKPVVWAVK